MCPSKQVRTVCQGCRKVSQEQRIELSCPTARQQHFVLKTDCPNYTHEALSVTNFICDQCLKDIGWEAEMLTG